MTRRTIVLMRGLQGSGKSTWARAWVAEDPAGRVRVCRDDLRAMMRDGVHLGPVTETDVVAVRDAIIRTSVARGLDVVVDETTLPYRKVSQMLDVAFRCKAELVIQDLRGVPLETCIARDAARPEPIGADVIRGCYEQHIAKTGDPR